MFFFVVDLEFTGFIPGDHEVAELGAVALDSEYNVLEEWEARVATAHPSGPLTGCASTRATY